jgi:DNA-binding NarL/FixJ family response regulator
MPKEITTKLDAKKSFESLTLREVEVLKQLAKGLGDKQIAEVLAITESLQRGIIHL